MLGSGGRGGGGGGGEGGGEGEGEREGGKEREEGEREDMLRRVSISHWLTPTHSSDVQNVSSQISPNRWRLCGTDSPAYEQSQSL